MSPCIICCQYTNDKTFSITDTINGIQIQHMLYDLNFKVGVQYLFLINLFEINLSFMNFSSHSMTIP